MFLRRHWRRLLGMLGWAVGAVAVGVLASHLLGRTAERLIVRSAEATAIGYARYVGAAAPGIVDLFEGRGLGAATRDELRRLRRLGDVFRFKLFDREGRQLLVSDDLDRDDVLAASRGVTLAGHQAGNATAGAIVLGGANFVEVKSGKGKADRPPLYAEAYVPLAQDGRVIGVVEVYVDQTAMAARIEQAFLWVGGIVGGLLLVLAGALAFQVRQRLAERHLAAERLRYLAEHDALSGALNRASFQDLLRRATWRRERGGPGFAVLCLDFDRFKEVNDSLGHGAGDAVLREATARLRRLLRHGDAIARLGGDEFAVLQTDAADSDAVARLAERIVAALGEPYEFAGQRFACSASVGAARFGADALDVDELMHKADVALYRAKSAGRGRYSFYDAAIDEQLESRRTLARDLRQAADDGTIDLHYQALYAADGTTLLGYEALMRWTHPTRGAVSPAEFIPLAEQTGQIDTLGAWALAHACRDAAGWPAPLSVSVNLSPAQFRNGPALVGAVAHALDRSGLAAGRLVLEITESLLLVDTDAVLGTLGALSALGVQIAMDDFGTGYSSLAYLWRFPFDKVKIDRAFTQGLAGDERVRLIVRSIVTLAHSMGMRVNAEGVETAAQLHELQRLGCDELQGFWLARPQPLDRLDHRGAARVCAVRPAAPQLDDIDTQAVPL